MMPFHHRRTTRYLDILMLSTLGFCFPIQATSLRQFCIIRRDQHLWKTSNVYPTTYSDDLLDFTVPNLLPTYGLRTHGTANRIIPRYKHRPIWLTSTTGDTNEESPSGSSYSNVIPSSKPLSTIEFGPCNETLAGSRPQATKSTRVRIFSKESTKKRKQTLLEHSPKVISHQGGFNVILTHATADFDSLASAVGLAKLWSHGHENAVPSSLKHKKEFDSASHVPTFVVLPRGAHPGVQRFLALHKHLFPIRSLKSLPDDLTKLNRLALVDAQRRDRIGPAVTLLDHANRITVVDHHVDQDSDIVATDYVVDKVGSVSTLIVERLIDAGISLTEAEATLMALGIHADTGSLCFDSTTVRDAHALAWCLEEGASQIAIAEHAQASLSQEQQGVLTQALINTNTTVAHGVSIATVVLTADGFIQGLASVTQDAMELSSSDVFLLGLVYETKSGSSRRRKKKLSKNEKDQHNAELLTSRLLAMSDMENGFTRDNESWHESVISDDRDDDSDTGVNSQSAEAFRRTRLKAAFDRIDITRSGFLGERDVTLAMSSSGIVLSDPSKISDLIRAVDSDGDGKIDFEEFVDFAIRAELKQSDDSSRNEGKSCNMVIIGRVKAGVSVKAVKLNKLLEKFGGGGHPKAASATVRLDREFEAEGIMHGIVDELIKTYLQSQPTVADFMTSPVLTVKQQMNEKQVEDIFSRYGVRALPVVDDNNNVIGLVSYQLVEAAKQRRLNKERKRIRQEDEAMANGKTSPKPEMKATAEKKQGTSVKGWMLQHVQTVEASRTMAEVEAILMENDVGSLPVVADGTKQLVGMVTRTDILRQHRYYDSLPYHNKGFADSIAARKPIIELRKRLKQFDLD